MKKALIIFGIVVLVAVGVGVGGFTYLKSRPVPVIEMQAIDISQLKDGTYQGNYDTDLVKATVSVQVQDGKLTDIDILKHDCGLGKAAERVTDEVIAAQSLEVDTVSSATMSSRVILKAIETALIQAK